MSTGPGLSPHPRPFLNHASGPAMLPLPLAVVLAVLLVGAGVDASSSFRFPEVLNATGHATAALSVEVGPSPSPTTAALGQLGVTTAQAPALAPHLTNPIPRLPGLEVRDLRWVEQDDDGVRFESFALSANDIDAIGRCELPGEFFAVLQAFQDPSIHVHTTAVGANELIAILWNV